MYSSHCRGKTLAPWSRYVLHVHIYLVSVADSSPFYSPNIRMNLHAPFYCSLPARPWLFLRSTARLLWDGKKQLRQRTDLFVVPEVPSCGLTPHPWHDAGGGSTWLLLLTDFCSL